MGQFNLDKYFRSRIQNHSDEMDTDALWASLDLEEKKKNRGLIFWMTGSLAILFLVATTSYFSSNNWEQEKFDEINTKQEKLLPSVNSIELNNKKTKTKTKTKTKSTSSNYREIAGIENSPSENLESPTANNTTSILNSNFESIPKKRAQEKFQRIHTKGTSSKIVSKSKHLENKTILTEPTQSTNVIANERLGSLTSSLAFIPTLETSAILSRHKNSFHSISDYSFINPLKVNNSRTAINIYGGYSMIQRELKPISSVDMDPFIAARNNSEEMLEVITIGTELQYNLRSRFYAKIGVQYQRINEKFQWQSQNIDTIRVNNAIISRYVSAQNDTTQIRGQGLAAISTEKTWISYNNHRFTNIPISLGYKIKKGPWSLFAEGSFHINIKHKYSGEQLDPSFAIKSEPTYLSTTPKHSISWAAGIGYQLTPKFNIYAQPHYQYILGSFTTKESNMIQKYQLYGLRIGVSCIVD